MRGEKEGLPPLEWRSGLVTPLLVAEVSSNPSHWPCVTELVVYPPTGSKANVWEMSTLSTPTELDCDAHIK